ncbi:MAG: hypothetical protein K6F21_07885 [Bacteroidales bacterium]|nr:hypothetical protein [Bacteroidales bacterium]
MRIKAKILLLIALSTVFFGCEKFYTRRYSPEREMVLIYYCAGYNDLSSSIQGNLDVLKTSALPFHGSKQRVLAFTHFSLTDSDFSTKTDSHLILLTKDYGKLRCDTLYTIDKSRYATDPAVFKEVLLKVQELYPNSNYSLIFSSHATGWLPAGRYNQSNIIEFSRRNAAPSAPLFLYNMDENEPKVKSIGAEAERIDGTLYSREMDLKDMAASIPIHLDYILFDACLMGGIEVAYELKDVTDKVAFSQAEVLARGFDYSDMKSLINDNPSIEDFCKAFYDYYNAQQNSERSATISVISTAGLEALADYSKELFGKYRSSVSALNTRSGVQKYYRGDKHWFFDFEDVLVKAGISDEEKASLDRLLEGCVTYKAATPEFLGIKINVHSGLSMYLPGAGDSALNEYYKTLAWNKAANLVE